MRPALWAVVLAVFAAGTAGTVAGWLAHGGEKTVTRTADIAPSGTRVLDVRALRAQSGRGQIAVSWKREERPEFGLMIWQRAGADWRRLFQWTVPATEHATIYDLRLRTADVTRDGREDLLVFEEHGGSAGTYVYRLFTTGGGRVREIAARRTTQDRTTVRIHHGELVSYDGIGKDPKSRASIHCCPLYWRRTIKRWNGERLVTAKVTRTKCRPSPSPFAY